MSDAEDAEDYLMERLADQNKAMDVVSSLTRELEDLHDIQSREREDQTLTHAHERRFLDEKLAAASREYSTISSDVLEARQAFYKALDGDDGDMY